MSTPKTEELQLAEIEIKKLEDVIVKMEENVELSKAFKRLKEDEDFKLVFEKHYLKDEVVRTTMLLADQHMVEEKHRVTLQDSLTSYSALNSWFNHLLTADVFMSKEIITAKNRIANIKTAINPDITIAASDTIPPEGK